MDYNGQDQYMPYPSPVMPYPGMPMHDMMMVHMIMQDPFSGTLPWRRLSTLWKRW